MGGGGGATSTGGVLARVNFENFPQALVTRKYKKSALCLAVVQQRVLCDLNHVCKNSYLEEYLYL